MTDLTDIKESDYILKPKQKRGFERQQLIIKTGLELLKTHSLDELSMGQIAQGSNCSVGNLYKRFSNKEGYFKVLFETVLSDVDADVVRHYSDIEDDFASLEEAVAHVVELEIHILRKYSGMIRAIRLNLLKTNFRDSRTLFSVRTKLYEYESELLKRFLPVSDDSKNAERDIKFALQVTMGHLIEIGVFKTGWILIEDADIKERVCDMLLSYLRRNHQQ